MAEAEASPFLAEKRYAVVTGANKGIGLEVCRQLASLCVVVVLTSRDEKRGLEALEILEKSGISSDYVVFHQLDVTDPTSVATLADFVKTKFGKLDILVNNAGVSGIIASVPDYDALFAAGFPDNHSLRPDMITQTYEQAAECLQTNYYGAKTITKALLPLLEFSDSPRIINVSSISGKLCHIHNEQIRGVLDNVDELTEEKIDEIIEQFLKDFKDGSYVQKGWIPVMTAYFVSKAVLSAYTRVLAKTYSNMIINCLCPGYVKTDINFNTGNLSSEEGGSRVVTLALAPHGSPSGLFYTENKVTPF